MVGVGVTSLLNRNRPLPCVFQETAVTFLEQSGVDEFTEDSTWT